MKIKEISFSFVKEEAGKIKEYDFGGRWRHPTVVEDIKLGR